MRLIWTTATMFTSLACTFGTQTRSGQLAGHPDGAAPGIGATTWVVRGPTGRAPAPKSLRGQISKEARQQLVREALAARRR
jgi:hypothetical protein